MRYTFQHQAYLSDEEITGLYDRMEREGLLDGFFHSAQCVNAQEFLEYVRSDGVWMFDIRRDDEVVAFAMLDNFSGESAYFHHCHFRTAWRYTRETAQHTLYWLRENCRDLSTLVGITPATNTLAVRYAERCGFKILGVIPKSLPGRGGQAVDAVLSVYTWRN